MNTKESIEDKISEDVWTSFKKIDSLFQKEEYQRYLRENGCYDKLWEASCTLYEIWYQMASEIRSCFEVEEFVKEDA